MLTIEVEMINRLEEPQPLPQLLPQHLLQHLPQHLPQHLLHHPQGNLTTPFRQSMSVVEPVELAALALA